MNVKIREPREIFGQGPDGIDRVDLDRSSKNTPPGATNDAVLSRAYRNQRDVLVTAHALRFGVYSTIVQMLESAEHWNDVGYEVLTGALQVGKEVTVKRGEGNSPTNLQNVPNFKLIDYCNADSFMDEIAWVAEEADRFIHAGLNPEDILIITLDDRAGKSYFRRLTEQFASRGISTNNVIADPFNEPPFSIEGKITLSTVYRAKGNEAPLVFVVGADAVETKTRDGRNKVFTAFTRTKAWLRVSGIVPGVSAIIGELATAQEKSPEMTFVMPDPKKINTVQRGFSVKQAKAMAARRQYIETLRAAGLSEDEIDDELRGDGSVIE